MTRPEGAPRSNAKSTTTPTSLRVGYLTIYNLVFAALWLWIGIRTMTIILSNKENINFTPLLLAQDVEPQARWIQTLTLIEVFHAAIGLIKSPLSTTAIQVLTRVIQVWMIWYAFPNTTLSSSAFPILVLAWAAADSIRYLYLALNLHGRAPGALVWLRYTMFYVLYPIGIGAEWRLMYRSAEPAGRISGALPWLWYFLLGLYGPGAYTMFTYMVKQRRKILGRRERRA